MFLLSIIPTYSQTRVDSLEYLGRFFKTNLLNTGFDKQLNTFHLFSRLQLYGTFDNTVILLNENFGSTFIRNETKNTRDEQHFNLNAKYLFNKDMAIGLLGNNSALSDNRSVGISNSSVNYATIFSEIKPLSKVQINPFAGYSSNNQIGVTDNGSVYGLEGTLDNLRFSDIDINSELRFRNEDIIPRRNLIRYFSVSVGNNFDRDISNNIRTNFSQNRKDFYFEADSITATQFDITKNIQGRTETAYQIYDRLSYVGFLDILSLDLSGGINWRNINRDIRYKTAQLQTNSLYDTQIDELKLEFDAITRYTSKLFNGSLRLNYYERDEKHSVKRLEGISENLFEQKSELEEQKNNNSIRATLALTGDLKLSKIDYINLSIYQSKLVYDTKSSSNDDDRDELLSIVRLRYLRNLSAFFTFFVNTDFTYGHTVYLFASRSSNNNQNRIIRLRTGGEFIGNWLRSYNSIEVSANYTVYDFQDITTNYQSYSFRQFTAVDSTTIKLINNVSLFTYGYLKLSEIGDFNWKSFTSRPTRFLKEIYIEPRLVLNLKRFNFSVGMRMFLLDTYSYDNNIKQLSGEYLSIGPIAYIDIFAWRSLAVKVRGYYEFISNNNLPDNQQASLFMQVNWNF